MPESVTLKTIMELMQTVASFGSGDGLRVVGNSEHMENLLHNLQVLIETQKYDSISPSNCIFLIGSQLNTFVSELHHVYHGTLQGTIDGKRNP